MLDCLLHQSNRWLCREGIDQECSELKAGLPHQEPLASRKPYGNLHTGLLVHARPAKTRMTTVPQNISSRYWCSMTLLTASQPSYHKYVWGSVWTVSADFMCSSCKWKPTITLAKHALQTCFTFDQHHVRKVTRLKQS